jgi:hypothetical protein
LPHARNPVALVHGNDRRQNVRGCNAMLCSHFYFYFFHFIVTCNYSFELFVCHFLFVKEFLFCLICCLSVG